jgi:hypothetical protein
MPCSAKSITVSREGFYGQKLPPEPKLPYSDIRQIYQWQREEYVSSGERWARFWNFYGGFALALELILLPVTWKSGSLYLAGVCSVVALGQYFYWFFLPHHVAPLTGALLEIASLGLRYLWNWSILRAPVRRALVAAIVLLDLFLSVKAGMQVVGGPELRLYSRSRAQIEDQLNASPGRHLVFVRVGRNTILRQNGSTTMRTSIGPR